MRGFLCLSAFIAFSCVTVPAPASAGLSGGDQVLCAVGRPCIDNTSSTGNTVGVHWKSDENYGHYNVRWSRPGRPETQVELGGGDQGSYTVDNAKIGVVYTFKVQGCHKAPLGSSHCSPWEEQTVTAGLRYGDDTCRAGFVWREAFGGDHVCVAPGVRDQAKADNAQAAGRRQPGPYGPDQCRSGFVWREANPRDHVCVVPEVRAQAADDNRQAAGRRLQR